MKPAAPIIWLAAPAAALASSLPATAQVFLTEAQALAAVFGSGASVRRAEKTLSEAERRQLQESSEMRFPEPAYTFFIGTRNEEVVGYALVMNEIGKSEPITFLVSMSPDGKVSEVVLMVYRESRGGEVKEKRFVRQFRGKKLSDPIRVNQDIVNYTGATLSSKALARGVKRALLLLEHFYPAESRRELPRDSRLHSPSPFGTEPVKNSAGMYRQLRYVMGTLCEIRLCADAPALAAHALAAGFAEVRRLDRMFSNYRADSELSRVNREAAEAPVPVSEEFWKLTREAVRYWRHSGGSFDVTVGPLGRLWGFRDGTHRVPSPTELADALARVGTDKLELDRRARTIRFRRPGMELDFGGLAKGYAADRAVRMAHQEGASAAMVNLGGSSLAAVGSAAERAEFEARGWVAAVADPRESSRAALLLEMDGGWALSSSGTYEQQFQAEGRTLSHLIDPRTGWPLEGVCAATVIARSGRRSEALTKPLLFARSSDEKESLPRFGGSDWLLLESDPGGSLRTRQRLRHTRLLVPV